MNLHQIVSGAIAAVNPFIAASLRVSTGYTTSGDGTQVPTYAAPVSVIIQTQPLASNDIRHLDNLNIQGNLQAVYLNGSVAGLVRDQNKGGDLLTFIDPDTGISQVWLVAIVLESWPDWTKLAVVMQNGG